MLKKKIVRVLALGCAAALAVGCLGLVACGGSSSDSSSNASSSQSATDYKLVKDGTLTVATSPDYQPMEYQEDGEIKGFDVALIKEIGKRLNLNVDVQNQSFDTIVTQVAAGTKFDCGVSSITITDERKEQVAFTDPYYDSNQAIVVLKDSKYKDEKDLNGEPIAAQQGSSGEDWVKENLKKSKETPFQETPDALAALRTGSVKAVVIDEPVAENQVSGEYKDCKVLKVIPTGEQYGIIVNKDNAALATAMNEQLKAMQSDGTIDKLKKEWIGEAAK